MGEQSLHPLMIELKKQAMAQCASMNDWEAQGVAIAVARKLLENMAFGADAHTTYKMAVIYARSIGIELEGHND
jgi:hypothetical protein